MVLQRPRPPARPAAAAPTSLGRTGAAADAHGREDPEEVVEAGSPVLQGAGRAGPPRVPGSGEPGARAGGPGRQRGPQERSRGAGAAGTMLGREERAGPLEDPGRWARAGARARRPSAEPWQPRGWVCGSWSAKSRAGAGAGLCSSGCPAWLSRGLPPSASPASHHSWPRPSAGRRSRASVPAPAPGWYLKSGVGLAPTGGGGKDSLSAEFQKRQPPPRLPIFFSACLVPAFASFPKSLVIPSHCIHFYT